LIGTVSKCSKCRPSENWLGRYSPKKAIRVSGLWLTRHINAEGITDKDVVIIEELIDKTKDGIKDIWQNYF